MLSYRGAGVPSCEYGRWWQSETDV